MRSRSETRPRDISITESKSHALFYKFQFHPPSSAPLAMPGTITSYSASQHKPHQERQFNAPSICAKLVTTNKNGRIDGKCIIPQLSMSHAEARHSSHPSQYQQACLNWSQSSMVSSFRTVKSGLHVLIKVHSTALMPFQTLLFPAPTARSTRKSLLFAGYSTI